MIGELNLYGVFLPALLVWALVAVLGTVALRAVLQRLGFYRLVWHPALFDAALFIVLLGGVINFLSPWVSS